MNLPPLDEILTAVEAAGCWWSGGRARVSNVSKLSDAYIRRIQAWVMKLMRGF